MADIEEITKTVYYADGEKAELCCDDPRDIQVLRSSAWYIGQMCPTCGPYSRISRDYYTTKELAQAALDTGDYVVRQRLTDPA